MNQPGVSLDTRNNERKNRVVVKKTNRRKTNDAFLLVGMVGMMALETESQFYIYHIIIMFGQTAVIDKRIFSTQLEIAAELIVQAHLIECFLLGGIA